MLVIFLYTIFFPPVSFILYKKILINTITNTIIYLWLVNYFYELVLWNNNNREVLTLYNYLGIEPNMDVHKREAKNQLLTKRKVKDSKFRNFLFELNQLRNLEVSSTLINPRINLTLPVSSVLSHNARKIEKNSEFVSERKSMHKSCFPNEITFQCPLPSSRI